MFEAAETDVFVKAPNVLALGDVLPVDVVVVVVVVVETVVRALRWVVRIFRSRTVATNGWFAWATKLGLEVYCVKCGKMVALR